jgi:4-aminobutyrate aminotransferase/(S)-3-amino-2-methylpropionate transaminase
MDSDNNVILDLNSSASNAPLGYNHNKLIDARDSTVHDRFLGHKVNVSQTPPHDYVEMLQENVMPIAPEGMQTVYLADGSVQGANQTALELAINKFSKERRVPAEDVCVMGFQHGNHGNSVETLSCSDASNNSQGVPTHNWPIAAYPEI